MKIVRDTLSTFSECERINSWFYKKISPYLGRRILEAGCGNGNITASLLDRELIVAVDNDEKISEMFKNRFGVQKNLKFYRYGLEDRLLVDELLKYGIDTILCINTLEHVKDDIAALNNFNSILKDGKLIILVPAFQALYCSLDENLGHYRRYSFKDLSKKLEKCGFSVIKKMRFNFFGIIGWFLNGRLLRMKKLSKRLLKLFNFCVPFLDFLDNLMGPPVGLSIILVCEKTNRLSNEHKYDKKN